jgi:hypothetical protein
MDYLSTLKTHLRDRSLKLSQITECDYVEIVRYCLNCSPRPIRKANVLLSMAGRIRNVEVLQYLLTVGVLTDDRISSLAHATDEGWTDIVKVILESISRPEYLDFS